jgi:hypothetical protein
MMMKNRRAYTMVETQMAVFLALLLLGILFELARIGRQMNRTAATASALQNALFIEDMILRDLSQMVIDPLQPSYTISSGTFSFFVAQSTSSGLQLVPVRYSLRRTRAGNQQLVRTEWTNRGTVETVRDAILERLDFSLRADPNLGTTRYLHADMVVLNADLPRGQRSRYPGETTPRTVVARIPLPSALAGTCLERTARMVATCALLPAE